MDRSAVATRVEERPCMHGLGVDMALAATLNAGTREMVARELFLPLDLHEASSEEIMLVQEVGGRMTHEFEESRPSQVMARFPGKIGRQVDEEEVAGLARSVVIGFAGGGARRGEGDDPPGNRETGAVAGP